MQQKAKYIAPLFDRLTDLSPFEKEEASVQKKVTLDQYKELVQRDVKLLLNTRHSRLPHSLKAYNESVTHKNEDYDFHAYGLPDFSQYDVSSYTGKFDLESTLAEIIEQFDTRLESVEVFLEITKPPNRQVIAFITATLLLEETKERFTFPVELDDFPEGLQAKAS